MSPGLCQIVSQLLNSPNGLNCDPVLLDESLKKMISNINLATIIENRVVLSFA